MSDAGYGMSIGCNCCGCDLFTFTDVLTAASGTSIIDGFTVVDEQLPIENYHIACDVRFSGRLDLTPPKMTCRLLKADDSVYAEWSVERSRDPQDVIHFEVEWDGVTLVSDSARQRNSSPSNTVLSNALLWRHGLTIRSGGGFVGPYIPASLIPNRTYRAVQDTIAGYFLNLTSPPEIADLDSPTRRIEADGGCPVRLEAGELEAVGPLRWAIKVEPQTAGYAFTVDVRAMKIYQEPIAVSCSESLPALEEANEACPWPVVCAVTYPHYTTPLWEVIDANSAVTLHNAESGHVINQDCVATVRYSRINTLAHRYYSGPEQYGPQINEVGYLEEDAADKAVQWAFTPPNNPNLGPDQTEFLIPTELIYKWNGSSYVKGSGPALRSDSLPFHCTTTVLATANPCKRIVRAAISVFAWWSLSAAASIQYLESGFGLAGTDVLGQITRTEGQFLVIPNWSFGLRRYGTRDAMNTAGFTLPYEFKPFTAVFEKEVDAWAHEPPTIEFGSANLITPPATWYLVTAISSSLEFLPSPVFRYRATLALSKVPVTNTSIAFTLRAHTTPKVPHP